MSTSSKPAKLAAPLAASVAFLTIPVDTSAQTHRPPATPLVTHDPYFCVWSNTDRLNEGNTVHWTGSSQPLTSLIRIDQKTYQLMGVSQDKYPALPQKSLQVLPTRTIYTFGDGSVEVRLTFTSPLLPDQLDVLSRPATYLTWDVRSVDGKTHDAEVYFGASGMLAVNEKAQKVASKTVKAKGLSVASVSGLDQAVLGRSGDGLRIEWGHLLLAVPSRNGRTAYGSSKSLHTSFGKSISSGVPAGTDDTEVAAYLPFGKVGNRTVSRHAILAYDDEFSIQYFGENLRPWWRRNGAGTTQLLEMAEKDYARLQKECAQFDAEVVTDMKAAGGEDYAYLGSLAYRQSIAAQKVVADQKGQPLMFSKENFSNGCIGTVDVLYPAAPLLLLFSPTLTKASLAPLMEYSASSRWKFPFAPHDLGQYPLANGQVYGGGERTEDNQMPVEETGNMLILLAALAKIEGNAKFTEKYWPVIEKWAAYLADKGFDPENQLCTDDFAGHLAHNVNLSAKAIEALGAYSYLADVLGHKAESTKYRALAQQFADRWMVEAKDGDHTKLAFDKSGTWSQKYNLVWDRLLDFNLFPKSLFASELAYYRTRFNAYGLPLDSRRDYTKLDWIVWTATLTGDRSDFDALVKPIVKFLDATPQRAPMADWYRTVVPDKEGFQARSVVGGVFIKLMENEAVWKKYASRDKMTVGGWAPIPKPPVVTPVVPAGDTQAIEWSYTTTKPTGEWFSESYDVSGWKKGPSGFGTPDTPGVTVRTTWNTDNIWVRREFDMPEIKEGSDLRLYIHHDDDAEVYINGVLAARLSNWTSQYQAIRLSEAGKKALRTGKNVIAIHCRQTGGGQYIDAGFAVVTKAQ